MAGFSRRFDASYRDAHAKVQSNLIGSPFIVRSQTCDLVDNTGFFVRYAKLNGGMFVDCCIHDIDLSLWFLGDVKPKAVWAVGTISHHPELKELNDVDNGVGIVEYWGGKITYSYWYSNLLMLFPSFNKHTTHHSTKQLTHPSSRTQAHGHDVSTEIIGTRGKLNINLVPRLNNVTIAESTGIRHEVQPEYWERFEDAFATEANEFMSAVLDDTPVPVKLEEGLISLKIGWALQEALLSGERILFDEEGERVSGRGGAKL